MSDVWTNPHWLRRTFTFAVAAAGITGVASFFWPKTFRAEGKILPNQSRSVASSLLGFAAASGFADLMPDQLGGSENSILTYPEILSSRALLQKVAFSSFPPGNPSGGTVLGAIGIHGMSRKSSDKGIRRLSEMTRVDANMRSGVLTVSAVTRDSVLSAYIVQCMLNELDHFNLDSRASRGRATREFIEGRLKEARQELTNAEQELASFRSENVRISNSAQLQLEQARLEREVDTRSELFRLLAREFEAARIEERRDTPTFAVVDPPVPPVRKYRPKILLNTLLAFLGVCGARVAYALFSSQRSRTGGVSVPS